MIGKSMLIVATLALVAAPALAINPDLGPNSIGVFFDQTADNNCATPVPYTTLTAYVLAVNPTQEAGISGWEATLLLNPTTFAAGITMDIGAEALNVLTAPVFQVGYAVKRTGNPVTLLTVSTFYLGGTILFGIGPCVPSSFAGTNPGYADGDDPSILVPLFQVITGTAWTLPIYKGSNTDPELPDIGPANSWVVAAANGSPCPTAIEQTTWGGVKDLYK